MSSGVRRVARVLSILLATGAVAAAFARGADAPTAITGRITCRESCELPVDASVRVWLETESSRHQPARHLAATTFSPAEPKFPVAYTLPYAPADVDPAVPHRIRVVISSGKRVLFFSGQGQPAPMDAPSPRIDIPVERFGAAKPKVTASSASVGLAGLWRLTSLPGTRLSVETGLRPPTLSIAGAEQKISGSTGCNEFFGKATAGKSNALLLDPSGMTRMACPDAATALEDAYLAALRATTAYRIKGGTLELLAGDRVVARLQRQRTGAPSD